MPVPDPVVVRSCAGSAPARKSRTSSGSTQQEKGTCSGSDAKVLGPAQGRLSSGLHRTKFQLKRRRLLWVTPAAPPPASGFPGRHTRSSTIRWIATARVGWRSADWIEATFHPRSRTHHCCNVKHVGLTKWLDSCMKWSANIWHSDVSCDHHDHVAASQGTNRWNCSRPNASVAWILWGSSWS